MFTTARFSGMAVTSWRQASSADPKWERQHDFAEWLSTGRQGPPLPDTDLEQVAGSNFLSNISLEPGGTGYVESLVRLQA